MITLHRLAEKKEKTQKVQKNINMSIAINILALLFITWTTVVFNSLIYVFLLFVACLLILIITYFVMRRRLNKINKQISENIKRILDSTFETMMNENLIILVDSVQTTYSPFGFLIDAYGDGSLTYEYLQEIITETAQDIDAIIDSKLMLYYHIKNYK